MGIGDLFKASRNKELEARVEELEYYLTPEMKDLQYVQHEIESERKTLEQMQQDVCAKKCSLDQILEQIAAAKSQLVETNEQVLLQSFGMYEPRFSFADSTGYKDSLSEIRAAQKDMIKCGTAATGNGNWTVNNSTIKGKKMVKDMQKLLIRAFNSECDDCIDHVKFNNFETVKKRITSSRDAISKLGSMMDISITDKYYQLKIQELHLAYEFQQKKQEEKENLKQLRAEERERVKLEREIEEARKKIEKEQKHYANALLKINQQIDASGDPVEKQALLDKKAELEGQVTSLDAALEQVDYRAANQKAGYVYIISNIGAFGENVYKIGMTRRLEPMDRIDELGDASVPFDFDVHALIFSDDAPALEASLHRAFEDRKLNMINTRREFFHVTMDEIKQVVLQNYDKTVEFVDSPAAEQYRQSLVMSSKKPQEQFV